MGHDAVVIGAKIRIGNQPVNSRMRRGTMQERRVTFRWRSTARTRCVGVAVALAWRIVRLDSTRRSENAAIANIDGVKEHRRT